MCIAIYKKPKGKLTDDTLANCWENNPDGAGLMFVYKNEVVVEKGFFDLQEFTDYFRSIETLKSPVVLHFRIRTHGPINEDNCHPHIISKQLAFVHNGIFNAPYVDVPKDSPHSDTVLFRDKYLKELTPQDIHRQDWRDFLDAAVNWGKLIFLAADGSKRIINEANGIWDHGVWYSNDTYKRQPKWTWLESDPKNDYWEHAGAWQTYCAFCDARLDKSLIGVSDLCWDCIENGCGLEDSKNE